MKLHQDSGMEAEAVTMVLLPQLSRDMYKSYVVWVLWLIKPMEMAGKGFDLFVQITTLVLLVMIFMIRSPSLS